MASFAGGPIPMTGVSVDGAGGNGLGFVNVGLSQALGNNLSQQSGINLAGGQNVLQSQLTPLISAASSGQLNDAVLSTVQSIGPLTSILPSASFLGGGGLMGGGGFGIGNILGGGGFGAGELLAGAGAGVGSLLSGLGSGVGSLLGGLGGAVANNKIWPGGGGNGPSDYGGFMHNLGQNGPDVVFSIVPANNGPQTAGLNTALSNPIVGTTLPTNVFTNTVPSVAAPDYKAVSALKFDASTYGGR